MLDLLDSAAAEGIRTSFDQYLMSRKHHAGRDSSALGRTMEGTDKLWSASPALSSGTHGIDMEQGIPGWDNFVIRRS